MPVTVNGVGLFKVDGTYVTAGELKPGKVYHFDIETGRLTMPKKRKPKKIKKPKKKPAPK